ncbi:MAG: hypothetical protein WAZ78_03435, partial [Candidatus Moraniibacteriota bacterium]
QIGSIILTAITEIGEFLAGDFFPDLLTFFSAPLGMIKNYLSNFPYAVLAVVVINLFLVVVILVLAEKMLGVFDALDRASIANQLKQFFGRAIITPKVRKPVVAQDIIRPNAENHIAPPISFAQAFITVSLLAFLAYSLPQKYQLANLIDPVETRFTAPNTTDANQIGGNQGLINQTPTSVLGETTQETLSLLAESNPNLYQLLTTDAQRRGSASSLQLGMLSINPQGQIFILPKSISSKEIKNHEVKNKDLADDSITSNTIKNHTIRSIDFQRELTIEELKINQNLTVRGNLTTEGSLTAVDMNLSGSLDLQDNLILNIGNTNTDFTTTGGLNLAGNLNINNNFLANATTGNITAGTYNGNTITNGTGTLTLDSYTLTLTNNSQLNQNLLTTSTPQFVRLGLGIATDTTNILTVTSSSTTDLSKTLNISHTGAITGTGYAGYFSKTGTSTTNVGLYAIATGATNNYALQVDSDTAGANNYTIYANGTAKNYFAGNIGIGTTAPSARLQVVGIDSSNSSFAANIAGATGTGLIVTNSGNVGIGTTSPGAKLEVKGDVFIGKAMVADPINVPQLTTQSNYGAGIILKNVKTDASDIRNWAIKTDGYAYGDLHFRQSNALGGEPVSAGTSRMVISNSGNVGIGTTSPVTKLHVLTSTTNDGGIIQNTSAGNGYSAPLFIAGTNAATTVSNVSIEALTVAGANADMYFRTGGAGVGGFGTARMVIKNDGNVGIGTTGPLAKLQVNSTRSNTVSVANAAAWIGDGPWGTGLVIQSMVNGAGSGNVALQNMGSTGSVYDLILQPNGGNVGIGTTGPTSKLHVIGASGAYTSSLLNTAVAGSSYGLYIAAGGNASDFALRVRARDENTELFSILGNGNVGIGTTSPGALLTLKTSTGGDGLLLQESDSATNAFKVGAYTTGAVIYGYNNGSEVFHVDTTSGGNMYYNLGNVGIGTTNPGYKLEVAGNIGVQAGSGTGNGIIFGALVSTYGSRITRFSDDSLLLGVPGTTVTQRLDIATSAGGSIAAFRGDGTSYFAGNVGIGTTTPQTKLDVAGTIRATAYSAPTSGTGVEILYGAQAANTGNILAYDRTASAYKPLTLDGSTILLNAYNTSGNVGIGTTGPNTKLQVNGLLTLTTDTNLWRVGENVDGANTGKFGIRNQSGGVNAVTILSGGNVGIGTTSPGQKLDVRTPNEVGNDVQLRLGSVGGNIYDIGRVAATGFLTIQGNQTGYNSIALAPTSGNVGIGTTGPGYKLDISSTGTSDQTLLNLNVPNTAGNNAAIAFQVGGVTTTAKIQAAYTSNNHVGLAFSGYNTGLSEMMRIIDGNVGIGTTGP